MMVVEGGGEETTEINQNVEKDGVESTQEVQSAQQHKAGGNTGKSSNSITS